MTVHHLRQFLAYTEHNIAELRYRRDRLAQDLDEVDEALAERERQAQDLLKEIERRERIK